MQTGNERLEADTIVDKIRGGEMTVVEAVAEALPEVFRTHVVAALDLKQVAQRRGVERGWRSVHEGQAQDVRRRVEA
jgi:hypothetical protein